MHIAGPELDPEGAVYFRLRTREVANLPDEFTIDIIFLFAVPDDCLRSIRVGPEQKQLLGARLGLEVQAPLPDSIAGRLLQEMDFQGKARLPLALPEAFAFRLMC